MELLPVALDHLLARRAEEGVIPVVVQPHCAREQRVPRALRLLGELARAREDRLHVGRGPLLAAHLGYVDGVVQRQRLLVVRPEGAQVEALRAEVVLVVGARGDDVPADKVEALDLGLDVLAWLK